MQPNRNYEKFAVTLMAAPVGMLLHAVVMQQWWGWFLEPHGLAALTIAQAIVLRLGAFMLISSPGSNTLKVDALHKLMQRLNVNYKFDDLGDHVNRHIGWAFLSPAIFWVVGWTIKTYVTT